MPSERTVLHVGCGLYAPTKLHPLFRTDYWREVRVDIDPRVSPDLIASLTDLSPVRDGSANAVWSSHNLEHLEGHEVLPALRELRRVLSSDGFLIATTPDIEHVGQLIGQGRLEDVVYESPAGPITPLDIMFGHQASIAAGNGFMAHRTAFSAARLGRSLTKAGFAKAIVQRGRNLDLWAVAYVDGDAVDGISNGIDVP